MRTCGRSARCRRSSSRAADCGGDRRGHRRARPRPRGLRGDRRAAGLAGRQHRQRRGLHGRGPEPWDARVQRRAGRKPVPRLMRACSGWPSGVWIDPPRRTVPDGSNFQFQHWSHRFEYALVGGSRGLARRRDRAGPGTSTGTRWWRACSMRMRARCQRPRASCVSSRRPRCSPRSNRQATRWRGSRRRGRTLPTGSSAALRVRRSATRACRITSRFPLGEAFATDVLEEDAAPLSMSPTGRSRSSSIRSRSRRSVPLPEARSPARDRGGRWRGDRPAPGAGAAGVRRLLDAQQGPGPDGLPAAWRSRSAPGSASGRGPFTVPDHRRVVADRPAGGGHGQRRVPPGWSATRRSAVRPRAGSAPGVRDDGRPGADAEAGRYFVAARIEDDAGPGPRGRRHDRSSWPTGPSSIEPGRSPELEKALERTMRAPRSSSTTRLPGRRRRRRRSAGAASTGARPARRGARRGAAHAERSRVPAGERGELRVSLQEPRR